MLLSMLSVAIGAAFGALLRWGLSAAMNPMAPNLPLGTLASNLIGGYLIGVAVAFFAQHPALPPQWRLLTVTGFLGGLTTFSTFSAEVTLHLAAGRIGWAMIVSAVHLFGSLACTGLGMLTMHWLRSGSAT